MHHCKRRRGMNKGTQSKSELISAGRNNRAVFNQHFDV
uniref:Uncharacterized protein n=1 Tax=Anguilla anguilla TaxID=7936 RepID=A0A0E9QHW9_ANGAN